MAATKYLRGPRKVPKFNPLKKLLGFAFRTALAALDRLVPKRANRVVLGCDKGKKYSGNPRALFEHLVKDDDWQAYWLTSSRTVYRAIDRQYPGHVAHSWSWKGVWLGLTSRWLCISHSRFDLGPFSFLTAPRFVYLNHGTPLKTMGYEKKFYDPATESATKVFGAITCCSSFEAGLWQRAYRIAPERVWVTGVPRNDSLFHRKEHVAQALQLKAGRKTVLFAPTYRESGEMSDYLPIPEMSQNALLDVLTAGNATMLVRPHYYEWDIAAKTIASMNSDRFVSADERIVSDVNDLLPFVDLLVTDYSSIYFDYLLLDRPIVFNCHDLEDYERTRGFMIDFNENTPGHKARTGEEFLSALRSELSGEDLHRTHRGEIRRRFHEHADDHSSDRIAARLLVERPVGG